jgi:FkbM family methyltransferase
MDRTGDFGMAIDTMRRRIVGAILRPYIYHELPGWGALYRRFVGDYRRDARWAGRGDRWMRGKLHGYEVQLDLGNWSNRYTWFLGRYYDLPTQLVLTTILRPGDTFVDVGANEGQMSFLASHLVGSGGHVVAVEPNPRPRRRLEAGIARNAIANIEVAALGLGEEDAVLPLTVPRVNSGEGSFGRPDYADDTVDIVECPVRRGDDVLAGRQVHAIKMDVEGFELQALRGLAGTIAAFHPPVTLEIVGRHLRNAGSRVSDVTGFMEGHGYRGYTLSVARAGLRQTLVLRRFVASPDFEGDVLWLRDEDPSLVRFAVA